MNKKRLLWVFFSVCIIISMVATPIFACTPKAEENFRVTLAVTTLHASSNPFLATGRETCLVMSRIYEPLVAVRQDGTVVPRLAKSWAWDAATKTMTLTLDERAKFSDGTAVTADDVKFTYDKQYEFDFASGADTKSYVESVTAPDKSTVKFKLKEIMASFMNELSPVYIVPKAIWEKKDCQTDTNLKPIGSGPFLWGEYVEQSHILMKKNANYWGGAVNYDELLYKVYGSEEAALLALRSGEADMVPEVLTYTQIPALLEVPDIKLDLDRESNFYQLLYLNLRFAPLDNKDVRKAINVAINKKSVIAFAASGYGSIPQNCPYVPAVEQNPAAAWEGTNKTDAERVNTANALLDGVTGISKKPATPPTGWVRTYNGTPMSYELIFRSNPTDLRTAEQIRDDMKAIGIELTLKVSESKAMMGLLFSGKQSTAWKWVIFGHGAQPSFANLVQEFGNDPYNAWYDAGTINWTNDSIQAPMRAARREMNETTRLSLVKSIQVSFSDEMPIIPIYQTVLICAYRTDRLTGWNLKSEFDGMGSSGRLVSLPNLISIKPIEKTK